MEGAAKLVTAVAALLGSVLWPTLVLTIVLMFRKPLIGLASQLPGLANRVETLTAWGLELKLRRLADTAAEHANVNKGRVSGDQVLLATEIKADASAIGEKDIVRQLDRLCREYDVIRRSMQSGDERTRAMTAVLVQMRALAPSAVNRVEAYKSSGSAGSRLAAIAMMQMQIDCADVDWLVERFKKDQPFIFYHAALALQNMADNGSSTDRISATTAANQALKIVRSFDGQPDEETVEVLTSLLRR